MRWFNFGILVIVLVVLQVGSAKLVGVGQQRIMPDLLLMTAIIFALRGAGYPILIACWVLGFIRDLTSHSAALGTYALAFGLIAMVVTRLHTLFYVDRPLTVILVTFAGAFLVEQFALVTSLLRGDLQSGQYKSLTFSIMLAALLTAVLAPYGQWLIMKLHRFLGLPRNPSYR